MVHGPVTKDESTWVVGLQQIRVGPSAANIATTTPVLTSVNSIGAMEATKERGSTEFLRQMSGFPKQEDGIIPLSEVFALEGTLREITPFNIALARGIDPTASLAAQIFETAKKTTAGTTTGALAVGTGAGWGVIDEEWTVVFTSATAGKIFGKTTGHVHTFANLTSAMEPVDGSSDKYFSIPADYFSGTWAADEHYVFRTMSGGATAYADAHTGSIGLGGLTTPADIRVESVYTYPNGTNTKTIILPRAKVAASMELDNQEENPAGLPVVFESKNASSDNAAGNAVWNSMPLGIVIWA